MERVQQRKQLKKIAYHEAGHAVAAYLCMRAFEIVTVIPEGDTLGSCLLSHISEFHPDRDSDSRTQAQIDEHMTMLYAGVVAEFLFTGRYNWKGSSHDLETAYRLANNEIGRLLGRCGIGDPFPGTTKRHRLFEALNARQTKDGWVRANTARQNPHVLLLVVGEYL